MKKVYQTIIDEGHGNCMQAAIASLFELNLEDVPHFLEAGDNWWKDFDRIFKEQTGNDPTYINRRQDEKIDGVLNAARLDGGINGYFYASVKSRTFPDVNHAVIVDTNLNVVHDPNPNGKALSLTPDDILGIYITKDIIIGKTGKAFTYEEWEEVSDEEKRANTYYH